MSFGNTKRIMSEIKTGTEMLLKEFGTYIAPEENDIKRIHFVIPGPEKTPFEGGLYHGMLRLNDNHPLGAPNLHMITPSGRFETETHPVPSSSRGICTWDTSYHPEEWSSIKNLTTIISGFISLMCDLEDVGAMGIENTPDVIKRYAIASLNHIKKDKCVEKLFPELHAKVCAGTYVPVILNDLSNNISKYSHKKKLAESKTNTKNRINSEEKKSNSKKKSVKDVEDSDSESDKKPSKTKKKPVKDVEDSDSESDKKPSKSKKKSVKPVENSDSDSEKKPSKSKKKSVKESEESDKKPSKSKMKSVQDVEESDSESDKKPPKSKKKSDSESDKQPSKSKKKSDSDSESDKKPSKSKKKSVSDKKPSRSKKKPVKDVEDSDSESDKKKSKPKKKSVKYESSDSDTEQDSDDFDYKTNKKPKSGSAKASRSTKSVTKKRR